MAHHVNVYLSYMSDTHQHLPFYWSTCAQNICVGMRDGNEQVHDVHPVVIIDIIV